MKKAAKKFNETDPSFYKFAKEVTAAIERNEREVGPVPTKAKALKEWRAVQQQLQVEELLDAEIKFKETILKYKQSTEIYKKFLQKICVTNKNILSARPYFRESAVSFSKNITPMIKIASMKEVECTAEQAKQALENIKAFNINYQFVKFIRDSWLGPFPKKAEQLFHRVYKARRILIENNMPLAINRAKLFHRKTPQSHLSLMDMIGICGSGLASAVDKWCGPYSKVFRGVIIGRCVGNLIEAYSETTIHFYPQDKRVLYKAHTIRSRQGIEDLASLTDAVNLSFKNDGIEGKSVPKNLVTVGDLSTLMSASSMVSADASVDDEGYGVYSYTEDESQDIEGAYIAQETSAQLLSLAGKLPILHKKILRLKGVKI